METGKATKEIQEKNGIKREERRKKGNAEPAVFFGVANRIKKQKRNGKPSRTVLNTLNLLLESTATNSSCEPFLLWFWSATFASTLTLALSCSSTVFFVSQLATSSNRYTSGPGRHSTIRQVLSLGFFLHPKNQIKKSRKEKKRIKTDDN